jgi:hypothetical protein
VFILKIHVFLIIPKAKANNWFNSLIELGPTVFSLKYCDFAVKYCNISVNGNRLITNENTFKGKVLKNLNGGNPFSLASYP